MYAQVKSRFPENAQIFRKASQTGHHQRFLSSPNRHCSGAEDLPVHKYSVLTYIRQLMEVASEDWRRAVFQK
jgi:hypothetical protein